MQTAKTQISSQGFRAVLWISMVLLCGLQAFNQDKPSIKWGRYDFLRVDATDTVWKYQAGLAKPEFFDPKFNDSGWQTVSHKMLDTLTLRTVGWPGIGTFRKRFTVPDSLKNTHAELFLGQVGASRIYLDGKLICQFGVVDGKPKDEFANQYPVKVELDSLSAHVLVLYYSLHISAAMASKFDFAGYGIELSPVDDSLHDATTAFPHMMISLCIILSFCLFFCFVYGFYPHRLASLMSVLFLAAFACIFAGGYLASETHDIKNLNLGEDLWRFGFAWHAGFLLLFHYSIYYNRLPKRSLIVAAAMIIELIIWDYHFDQPRPQHLIMPFTLLFQVESWRIIILGIRKKKTGFWILAIGMLASIIGVIFTIFDLLKVFPWYLTYTQAILSVATDLSFPLTLALQLAWEFGSANRDLRRQLKQVNNLSAKNLEQEREKQQILSAQNETLEQQVAERTSVVLAQNKEIEKQRDNVTHTLEELRATQNQLIQSEKMASLGQLTAGIAHEIQNPLNFVNNFSEVNRELLIEMNDEISKGNSAGAKSIAEEIIVNEEKISHHGKRADAIVKGMLQHSRSSTGQKDLIDINALAEEYLRLSFQGLRAKDRSFNSSIDTHFDPNLKKANVIPQEIGRVLLNLYNNAFYAVFEKEKMNAADEKNEYAPLVAVSTKQVNGKIEIVVQDNGRGIAKNIIDKIFQPFFTTKPTGQGTGLGLSLSYDIIQAHGGEINVESSENNFTRFTVLLPAS